MAFPAVGVTPPALASYQFSWLGYTIGPNQPLELTKIEGLDMQGVRTGDSGRARDRGRFIGLDEMDGRDITLTGELALTHTNWEALAAALVPGGVTESPLWFALPGWGTLATMARVRKHNMPLETQAVLGQLANITVQWSCSDPCFYTTPTQDPSVTPPGTTAGFSFPLAFPLSFGGGTLAGALSINNTGNIESRPLLVVTGPCTGPSITNSSAPGSPNIAFNLAMASGDTLVIDMDMHTATYFTAGSTIGGNRLASRVRGSQWWSLQPGVNSIEFLTSDTTATGTLTVEYASAILL